MEAIASLDPYISIVALSLLYCVGLGVYRLYLSPLAKFPGPRFAALTLWFEFYYDVIKQGRYTWKIAEMHKQYGPIIRISPHELHIDDPKYYDELYVTTSRRTMKYHWAMKGFGSVAASTFATVGHETHRMRRAAVAPFFSKSSMYQLEPEVQGVVDKLTSRLEKIQGTGSVINLIDVFTALTADVIVQYAFAKPYGFIDNARFAPDWHQAMMDASQMSHLFKQFGWLEQTMRRIPPWIVTKMNPQFGALFALDDMIQFQVLGVKAKLADGKKPEGQKTVFYELLTNEHLPTSEKETNRLVGEGTSLVAAGSMTTAHTLSVIAYHLISDTEMLERLQDELKTVMPRPDSKPKWNQLEQLPYFSAVVLEGLRWGYGVTERLQRVSPDEALTFNDWTIPPGTPVGMSSYTQHNNTDIFPSPRSFRVERWLGSSGTSLRKYLVTFSKGSRQCLGMNLAYCELYLTIAAVFAPGRFNFELFETSLDDIEIVHDFFNACYSLDSKGLRVIVKDGEKVS